MNHNCPTKIQVFDDAGVVIESLLEGLSHDKVEDFFEIFREQISNIAFCKITDDIRDIWLIDTLGLMIGLGKIYDHAIVGDFVMILSTPSFVSELGFAFCLSLSTDTAPSHFLPVPPSVIFKSK